MRWVIAFIFSFSASNVFASEEGQSIYLYGKGSSGQVIPSIMNDLKSSAALACVNCHKESGLGTSESGRTIPPVSWSILGENQPPDNNSRFNILQNKRPAYNSTLLHRILTRGINSKGLRADPLMPRYELSKLQTESLLAYLKTLYAEDDPGVDEETIAIATVIDSRLPDAEKKQHREFIEGLFRMKNAATRGEIRRKKYSPIQRTPQYEAYRKWELLIWELPAETGQWEQALNKYYQDKPAFAVLSPTVRDNYAEVQQFCHAKKLPCLFPHNSEGVTGDYYNFVYRDSKRQRGDYIASKLRNEKNALLYLGDKGEIGSIRQGQTEIPITDQVALRALDDQFDNACVKPGTLILAANNNNVREFYEMECPGGRQIEIMLLSDPSMSFQDIVGYLNSYPGSPICWVTDYGKVLRKNLRKTRVSALTRKFGMNSVNNENLAQDLFAFGLLGEALHQLAGNFSRTYLMENIEHMLNSFPNFTYFSSVSGAPYQRAIVGPYKEYCPAKSQT
ncbi:MAG: hypothetical protein GY694_20825 [Gammaproteobacteria bacterium]|nr:hypothetical protein [Gammaproteobacteria bacterium]